MEQRNRDPGHASAPQVARLLDCQGADSTPSAPSVCEPILGEVLMFTSGNVGGTEKVVRIVAGISMAPLALALPGLWKALPMVAGVLLLLTAFAGY